MHGHFGARAGRSTNDANLFINSWIKNKWREKKTVSASFLDVKSAYPSVINKHLTHILKSKNCPSYLYSIIHRFLSDRTTSMRLEGFVSNPFKLKCGLPQGSPLSPILYIIYNSDLLSSNKLELSQDQISLGFIDDVVHLSANKNSKRAVDILEERAKKSLT